ncbi:hypothetical protein DFR50_114113 [Roseiarcus fermentans]|uniref:TY-Chap N-terminal domain-containing protein n=1 Tax=Roseiarcus fermentans TaxID=1473586 RepID=A0A366FC79_9HYPH|nr:hypothetical protein [Roseiarcus fermentans]RBP12283.1 hypothetical protein DFR50_114113 [Roseiarcus fermentans]
MTRARATRTGAFAIAFLLGATVCRAEDSPSTAARVQAALANVATLQRPDQDGLVTAFDGNKYIQCRRLDDATTRCEAGGALLQPSLAHVLTPTKIDRLAALGWRLDPSFGNYLRVFPAGAPNADVAAAIVQALAEGYDADVAHLDVRSDWIARRPCPPRNGQTQNLAGAIADPPAFPAQAIRACAYAPPADTTLHPPTGSVQDLIDIYGARVTGEIQRLRVNLDREIYVIFDADIGYVQCAPETKPPSIYCEAQSADSWPALSAMLTADRVARLHAAGFADPGRAPNYWKSYPLDSADDATIARDMLTILHDVYGYTGAQKLKVTTERSPKG